MKLMFKGSVAAMFFVAMAAYAQESAINVQCPTNTPLHKLVNASGQTEDDLGATGPFDQPNPNIKCTHLVAGDGMVTMADDNYANDDGSVGGKKLYIFSFARLPGEGALYPDPGSIPAGQPTEIWPTDTFSGVINDPGYGGWVMDKGLMAANAPAPTIAVDEDDEVYLTLTNVTMAMRPDLFDPHTVHWHGFPQAASVFDGVPDASISINMGASLTYYYLPKDAGTYMFHCHVEAAEHMQMGMLGNLYVRARQNKLPDGTVLNPSAPPAEQFTHHTGYKYAYNDGDGSTRYDVEVPVQLGSFDPNFHDAHLAVQPLPFAGMRDRYFLMNGRGYPDTVDTRVISTVDPNGVNHHSQPISSLIEAAPNKRILLRISNLNVTQFNTVGISGIPMEVVALDARLLRDGDGNNMYYKTQSITLGGGQSADVIIDTTGLASGSRYFFYTTNLHQLANDAENFGGMMTEIRIN